MFLNVIYVVERFRRKGNQRVQALFGFRLSVTDNK